MLQTRAVDRDNYFACEYCEQVIRDESFLIDEEQEEAWHIACREKFEAVEKSRLTFYTTCPECYDGFGTRHESVVGKTERGKEVRKVTILPEALEWQSGRYGSGLYGSPLTQADFDYQVKMGWIIEGGQTDDGSTHTTGTD